VDENNALIEGRRYPPYDRSKAEGQREVRKAIAGGLNAVIINPTGVFGPYDYQPSFSAQLCSRWQTAGCRRWLMADSIG